MTEEEIKPATEEAAGTDPGAAPAEPVAEAPVDASTEGAVLAPTEEGKE